MVNESRRAILIRFGIGAGGIIAVLGAFEAGKVLARFIAGPTGPAALPDKYETGSLAITLVFLVLALVVMLIARRRGIIPRRGHIDYVAGGITFLVALVPAFLAAFLTSQGVGYNWGLGIGVWSLITLTCILVWLGIRPKNSPVEPAPSTE